jgi:molybdopterin converting factor small subunit
MPISALDSFRWIKTMKIKLFGGLRQKAETAELDGSGATIREILHQISADHAELGEALFANGSSDLRPHIRIMVNGLDSELIGGLDTAVGVDDQIAIFPPIAGG